MFAASKTAAVASAANYIEDVFSTYLYTGNSTSGGTQTITNNIDLSTKGGMVWIKGRSAASDNILTDTARGAGTTATNNQALSSNLTSAEDLGGSSYDFLSAFNTDGFTVKQGGTTTATRGTNYNAVTYSSWTFRKQAKFFDVVTYTGNGSNRTISHNLGSVPGTIIIKRTDTTGAWAVYHRSLANTEYLVLNTTAAKATGATYWNSTTPTSTEFSLGTATDVNANTGTYVAYLFAHDAGGFGASGTDNVISCGSFTADGSGNATVTLGYEPQWLLIKSSSNIENWVVLDNMRGISYAAAGDAVLYPNLSNAEVGDNKVDLTSTGFYANTFGASRTYIYIAIRRGPMRTPTSGTSVFTPAFASSSGAYTATAGFPVDAVFYKNKSSIEDNYNRARLFADYYLVPNSTAAEVSNTNVGFMSNTAFTGGVTGNFSAYINWMFQRAPGFFDVVCYTGTGTTLNPSHNLTVAPELKIIKRRETAVFWLVGGTIVTGNTQNDYLVLDTTAAKVSSTTYWSSGNDSSTTFSTRDGNSASNANGSTYVAYLFATVAGVSKVGSYTGTGTTKQIDCGFAAGARFVLIKRTDSTGDWYVWDSARGIVAGNDPYLLLNSTAAEVTNTDYVDTYSAGFEISSTAPAAINANGGTFIFLAIA